jgi:hypothetical protein
MKTFAQERLPVLSSVSPIVKRCRRVRFHPECIERAVETHGASIEEEVTWAHPCHYFDGTEESIRWIFVLDVLNHCFWPDPGEPVWTVTLRDTGYSGYWGLAASLKRAVEQGIPITDARYLTGIPRADLQGIFSGEGEIPLFEERLANLREAGRAISTSWGGDIMNLLRACGGSGIRLVLEVVNTFPSFRDEAVYDGEKVFFWKRAQIFAANLYAAFAGEGIGKLAGMDGLTAFADYKLPQVLRELGIIAYSADLADKIDTFQAIEPGGEEEVEIRAVTLHAVETLRVGFAEKGRKVSSIAVDEWLWRLGQLDEFRTKPYHRCRTIFY